MNSKTIILIVVVIAVILGGAYFVLKAPAEKEGEETVISPTPPSPGPVSTSDALPTLEQELETTDLGNLDREFADIEEELNAALGE